MTTIENKILLRNCLKIASMADWSLVSNKELLLKTHNTLIQNITDTQTESSEQLFCKSWERLVDSKLPIQFVFPAEVPPEVTLSIP